MNEIRIPNVAPVGLPILFSLPLSLGSRVGKEKVERRKGASSTLHNAWWYTVRISSSRREWGDAGPTLHLRLYSFFISQEWLVI
jgi:hypothetical protein